MWRASFSLPGKEVISLNKKFLKHYMETNPEGTAQTYIFLVDNQDIALNIVMSGYQALCLVQEDDGYYFSADSFIEEMKFIKFMPDGSISEEVLEKGVHYVDVALNEVPLFIRSGKCIPVAEAAECVKDIDTENMQLIGYEGSSYTLYEDDGIHKDYDKKENYRVLTK